MRDLSSRFELKTVAGTMRPPRRARRLGALGVVAILLGAGVADAEPKAKKPAPSRPASARPGPVKSTDKPGPRSPEQKEADRHFKAGVALFNEAKYTEALAEFERAYEIAPHPLVLYNIAGCHRELSHYSEAVSYYKRFLAVTNEKIPAPRLNAAKDELESILLRIARVNVTLSPAIDGVVVAVDGNDLSKFESPLLLSPGDHKVTARAAGRRDAERSLHLASGDEVDIDLVLAELPPPPPPEKPAVVTVVAPAVTPARPRQFAVGVGFGTNLTHADDTGTLSFGATAAVGSRLELGVEGVVRAWALIPSIGVRVAGDAVSLHIIGAMPVAFIDRTMSTETFVAGAFGLGLRYRAMPSVAFRVDSYASFATKGHGTTFPTFLRGELWF
jgi:hypothetical protein